MSEFQEVYKQYRRMCSREQKCDDCDIYKYINSKGYIESCSQFLKEHSQEAEEVIMNWTTEHPEPVYPTWEEFLANMMTVDMVRGETANPNSVEKYMRETHIPAGIAEKLGIDPKEG